MFILLSVNPVKAPAFRQAVLITGWNQVQKHIECKNGLSQNFAHGLRFKMPCGLDHKVSQTHLAGRDRKTGDGNGFAKRMRRESQGENFPPDDTSNFSVGD
jgi:hypothetical protein